jgi:hypothetical protein
MARLRREDRASVKNVVLSFKLTEVERALIGRLVKARAEEVRKLTGQRLNITAGSYLRWLVLRDAEARGMSPDDEMPQDAPPKQGAALAGMEPSARKKPSKAAKSGPKRG